MEPISIGEAARKLGVNASALRYYDERGLLRPAARRSGRRVYGVEELRRLAFIHLAQRLGISLDTAAAVLDEPSDRWRQIVGAQIASWRSRLRWPRAPSSSSAMRCTARRTIQRVSARP